MKPTEAKYELLKLNYESSKNWVLGLFAAFLAVSIALSGNVKSDWVPHLGTAFNILLVGTVLLVILLWFNSYKLKEFLEDYI